MSKGKEYQSHLFELFKDYRPEPDYPAYPPYHVGPYLEEYFCEYGKKNPLPEGVFYIPVFWTNCYLSGKTTGLQEKIDQLEVSFDYDYVTISQHDDAIKEELPRNTIHFNAGGNNDGIPIPLICSPAPKIDLPKTTFCSFTGSITHPLRHSMCYQLRNDGDFELYTKQWNNRVKDVEKDFFLKKMAESEFSLCPRGYGPTSFRLYESLQLGSIPVYVSDRFWLPFKDKVDWESFVVLIEEENIKNIPEILKNISPEKKVQMIESGKKAWNEFFSLEGCCKTTYNIINNN